MTKQPEEPFAICEGEGGFGAIESWVLLSSGHRFSFLYNSCEQIVQIINQSHASAVQRAVKKATLDALNEAAKIAAEHQTTSVGKTVFNEINDLYLQEEAKP